MGCISFFKTTCNYDSAEIKLLKIFLKKHVLVLSSDEEADD